ncbi:uncharacterized protein LOC119167862 [Rhipicephalus microplus]|uniref:uncharacterized protein LOC119167862 n=1 Tax=Rhipicephalus microplus TaxID=6941 RepID=UPI003F6AEBE5
MKVALVTVVHVLIIVAQLELAKARVYMGRAQEDLSRLAGWRGKHRQEDSTVSEAGEKKQRVRGTRTLVDKVLAKPWGKKDHGREETLRITYEGTREPSTKQSRGPRHLVGKPGGYYVGNEPRWKLWKQYKKRGRQGQRTSLTPTGPAGKENETGIDGHGNILPETGIGPKEGVSTASGGTNNMKMAGGMGGYGGMMDPMSVGMMGSMGMGVGYGMTMGMGLGMASVLAPSMIGRATASLGNAATGIAKAIVAGKELSAIKSRRARRSRRNVSDDTNGPKSGDDNTDKKSNNSDSGADKGKKKDSKTDDEKKSEGSGNGDSTVAKKEE